MSTFLTHAIAASAAGLKGGLPIPRSRLLLCSGALAVIPDVDVLFRYIGISDDGWWGHRGLTHSLPFAALMALLMLLTVFRRLPKFSHSWWVLWGLLFLAGASHGLLDALTSGGQGIALLAPFDSARYTFRWRPLPIPAVGIGHFMGSGSLLLTEAKLVWLPVGVVALCAWAFGRISSHRNTSSTRPTASGILVALACLSVFLLCAFLQVDTAHEISRDSIVYRGVSEEEAVALVAVVGKAIEEDHEVSLGGELMTWKLRLANADPAYRYRILPDSYEMPLRGSGTGHGDLDIPLEYRFRVRPIALRQGSTHSSAGVAFDLEVEVRLPDEQAGAALLMRTLIRDRLSLLFSYELDKAARELGTRLSLISGGDPALELLPAEVGGRRAP